MMANESQRTTGQSVEYVTVTIDDQLFGLPIAQVQNVFVPDRVTRVPLAPEEIAGIINLRGRIVTAIDMRRRLGLADRAAERPAMAIGIEQRGEAYALLVDTVGEVLSVPGDACEPTPANMDPRLTRVASGVIRLDSRLLVVLDVDRVMETGSAVAA